MHTAKIAMIGTGKMGSSLLKGLLARGYPPDALIASDPHLDQLPTLLQDTQITFMQDNQQAINKAQVIILAVKPQVMPEVLAPLQTILLKQRPLIISIAAGITIDTLGSYLNPTLAMIRAMPNTPAQIQQGITALYANAQVYPEQKTLANTIFQSVGKTQWVTDENQMNAITALSGSGPAYFFLMLEALINAGIEMGLDKDLTQTLVLQTALGSIQMAIEQHVDIEKLQLLRQQVTSPGGTTAAALKIFADKGFVDMIDKAIAAATQRAEELSTGNH